MRHQNSVFHDLLKRVPWAEFDRLVAAHNADRRVRRLPTKSQFIALLYGQLSGAASLREIVGGLESHAVRLYHVGGPTASRSTLADARPRRAAAATPGQEPRDPFGDPVREVRVRIETGKVLRILSNDLDATAQDIADLYKRRFRWVKRTLKIRHFLGTSENAVRIQVAVALIAFLLLRAAQAAQKLIESPLAFARLVRTNLMHRRHLHHLLGPPEPASKDPNQLALQWTTI